MSILVTICARGGSKGIPGKNIKAVAGRPLMAYTIDAARKLQTAVKDVDIAVSTDSEEILKVASEAGLETPYRRPARLADDHCGKLDAIADVLEFYERLKGIKYDYVIDMDCTSPLRTLDDLLQGLEKVEGDKEALDLFSVSPASRNPYFNMVELKENGYYDLVKDGSAFTTRQSSPLVYDMNASFYIYRRKFFELGLRDPNTKLSLVHVMDHLCFDLDEPSDFEYMSFLMENDKLPFMK